MDVGQNVYASMRICVVICYFLIITSIRSLANPRLGGSLLNNEIVKIILNTLNLESKNDLVNEDFLEEDTLKIEKDFEATEYSQLIQLREYKLGFTNRLLYRYSKPIQELEIFLELCKTIGNNTLERLPKKPNNKQNVIRRLHQKSTLISSEIIHLIKGGYSAAAISRWRTLLETSIVAIFLAMNDEDVSQMYLDHEIVGTKKELNSYRDNNKYLGFEEIPEEVILDIEKRLKEVLTKYGKDFNNDYGWASKILENANPNLHSLMDYTNSQYIKPFYKFSNNYIHGNSKSLFYNLGYIDGVLGENTISSPSNFGFTDPAQLCALSYFNSTLAFLSVAPNEEDFTLLIRLYFKISSIANKFSEIEEEIRKEEEGDL